MKLEIGLARPDERQAIWELYKRTFLATYPDEAAGITWQSVADFLNTDSVWFPKNWQEDLEHPSQKRTVYVARYQGKVVGVVAPVILAGNSRITALYVAPEYQNKGVGTKLMKAALAHHGDVDIYIGIAAHLEQLRRFYEHLGFKVVKPGRLHHYPPDPIAYIEMVRPAPTA